MNPNGETPSLDDSGGGDSRSDEALKAFIRERIALQRRTALIPVKVFDRRSLVELPLQSSREGFDGLKVTLIGGGGDGDLEGRIVKTAEDPPAFKILDLDGELKGQPIGLVHGKFCLADFDPKTEQVGVEKTEREGMRCAGDWGVRIHMEIDGAKDVRVWMQGDDLPPSEHVVIEIDRRRHLLTLDTETDDELYGVLRGAIDYPIDNPVTVEARPLTANDLDLLAPDEVQDFLEFEDFITTYVDDDLNFIARNAEQIKALSDPSRPLLLQVSLTEGGVA